jgi:glutathione synthase/RimK-type ligase-like ATP-grasp enzyme
MTKFAILHQDLEWAEQTLQRYIVLKGHEAILVDLNDADNVDFTLFDVVLNRVYASVANRNWQDNLRALDLLIRLEEKGVKCVNSHTASLADYSKYLSACKMSEAGVPTPETIILKHKDELSAQAGRVSEWGYPLVIKREMGGRAVDIFRAVDGAELTQWLEKVFSPAYQEAYAAGQVIQPFFKSIRPYDIRIAIVNGRYSYSYTRSLVPIREGETPWLGSGQWGSDLVRYRPNEEEIRIAIAATKAIDAFVNEVDMIETESGYLVIENNPTPGFTPNKEVYLNAMGDALMASFSG